MYAHPGETRHNKTQGRPAGRAQNSPVTQSDAESKHGYREQLKRLKITVGKFRLGVQPANGSWHLRSKNFHHHNPENGLALISEVRGYMDG